MAAHRRLVGPAVALSLLVAITTGCSFVGPDLNVGIDNTGGRNDVTVTVVSSAPDLRRGGHEVIVPARTGSAWSVPLGSTWEIAVDGRHVVGSDDRVALALPSPGQWQDVSIEIRIGPDGTVKVTDAH